MSLPWTLLFAKLESPKLELPCKRFIFRNPEVVRKDALQNLNSVMYFERQAIGSPRNDRFVPQIGDVQNIVQDQWKLHAFGVCMDGIAFVMGWYG